MYASQKPVVRVLHRNIREIQPYIVQATPKPSQTIIEKRIISWTIACSPKETTMTQGRSPFCPSLVDTPTWPTVFLYCPTWHPGHTNQNKTRLKKNYTASVTNYLSQPTSIHKTYKYKTKIKIVRECKILVYIRLSRCFVRST